MSPTQPDPEPDDLRTFRGAVRAGSTVAKATFDSATDLYRGVLASGKDLEFQVVGRLLLHAALVGLGAGLFGAVFVRLSEWLQELLLAKSAGYSPLCAAGEVCPGPPEGTAFNPWLLALLPAAGGLVAGIIGAFLSKETFGGGGNVIIDVFHNKNGEVRRRVPFLKVLASSLALGSGGSGGREGPTMLIGGSVGSIVGRYLNVTPRERRILVVAGVAAGIAAVFRTPLGAALLAVEVFYRDDFEAEALIPAVFASVVGYSSFIFLFGEERLFDHAARYPFAALHLPLYALMALMTCVFAGGFVKLLRTVEHATATVRFRGVPAPHYLKPALGGLLLGVLVVPLLVVLSKETEIPLGQGLGILGGSYGAAQIAVTGADFLPFGWAGALVLVLLALLKLLATSLTVGTGGSAGDFGPSLVIGGLLGGAFGRAAQLLVDPAIDPGAFALVGMGTFYGGIAHVPLASLVLVCELSGSYDLLVPMMLSGGIAFVALRRVSVYPAQPMSRRESPAHREDFVWDVLRTARVSEVMTPLSDIVVFEADLSATDMVRQVAAVEQSVFPVVSEARVVGLITTSVLRTAIWSPQTLDVLSARDLSSPATALALDDDLHTALERLLDLGQRGLPVVDGSGNLVGLLDEARVGQRYHLLTQRQAAAPDAQ